MEDDRIVGLYWERSEEAIKETALKYGRYLNSISFGILRDEEDAKECVNDTYNDAWESIPPHRPSMLSTFLGKITRRISIDLLRRKHADKRGGGEMALALEELDECVQGSGNVENEVVRGNEQGIALSARIDDDPALVKGLRLEAQLLYFLQQIVLELMILPRNRVYRELFLELGKISFFV